MPTEARRIIATVVLSGFTAYGGQVCAQTAPATASTPAHQLSELQAQIPVLKAQAEIAKLKAEIANAGAPQSTAINPSGIPGTPMMGITPSYSLPPATAHETAESPLSWHVLEINGFNGRYTAVLADSDGRAHAAAPGLTLPGGWRVVAIAPHTVTLAKGSAHHALEF